MGLGIIRVLERRDDKPCGDGKLCGLLDRHVEKDDILLRHEHQETTGRVRHGRHEDRPHVLPLADPVQHLAARCGGDEDDDPGFPSRELHQADLFEAALRLAQHRLENLFQRLVERTDQRHAVEQTFAELQHGTAEQVCGQRAEQRYEQDRHQQPDTGDRERQVVVRVVMLGNQRLYPGIDPGDKRPRQVGGDAERGRNDKAREEVKEIVTTILRKNNDTPESTEI